MRQANDYAWGKKERERRGARKDLWLYTLLFAERMLRAGSGIADILRKCNSRTRLRVVTRHDEGKCSRLNPACHACHTSHTSRALAVTCYRSMPAASLVRYRTMGPVTHLQNAAPFWIEGHGNPYSLAHFLFRPCVHIVMSA